MAHTVILSTGEKIKQSNGHTTKLKYRANLRDKVHRSRRFTKKELKWQTPEILLREYASGYNAGSRQRKEGIFKLFDKLSLHNDPEPWERGFLRGFKETSNENG